MTVASRGTLTVVNGSMPDAAIVLADSTGNYVAEYQFSAQNEGFTVDKLQLKVDNNFATSTSAVSLSYKDKDGATKTNDGMFISSDTLADATATFTGLTMYVPANSDATLKVYISMTSLSSNGVSGANSTVRLDADEGFNATGDSGTTDTTLAAADLTSNAFYNRKSKPTFAKQTLTGAPSTGNPLYKFTVVADNAGNIEIKQLAFTVTTNGCDVASLYLYKPSSSTQITDNEISPLTTGGTVALIVGAIDSDVLTIGTTAETYEVRGTVTNYSSADADSVAIKFTLDAAGVANQSAFDAGADDITSPAAGAANNYNVWSDRSGVSGGHTTETADWTNGYLLEGMGDTQQLP